MSLLKLNVPTEAEEQEAFFKMVHLHETKYPELGLVFMIPNGAYLGADRQRYGAKLKAQGLRPGIPDIFCPIAADAHEDTGWELHYGLFIEMKRLNSSPSQVKAEQRALHGKLRAEAYRVEVCKGWRAAWAVLCDYLGLEEMEVK